MEARSNLNGSKYSDDESPIDDKRIAGKKRKNTPLGKENDANATYKPRPHMPKPQVALRTLASLMMDLQNGSLNVNPEYQRDVVWPPDRMAGLINSLMENFYIPPIILNKIRKLDRDNGTPVFVFVCVDGKQRLSSIRDFINGLISCHDHKGEKWWFCDTTATKRKKVLDEETKNTFLEKELVSFEFSDLSPDQEEDLFARVQMGIPLSAAEKFRASSGPWQELAKLFVEDFPAVNALLKDGSRAKDFQLTLSCFSQIMEVMHPSGPDGIPTLKTSHTFMSKFLSDKNTIDDGVKSHLARVWNKFTALIDQDADIFTNDSRYLKGVQTFAPVEMVAVTVLISVCLETRNNRVLLEDIKTLRIGLREEFADLRLNANSWKPIWTFISNLKSFDDSQSTDTLIYNLPRQAPATSSANQFVPIPRFEVAKIPPKGREVHTADLNTSPVCSAHKGSAVKREAEDFSPSLNCRAEKIRRTNQNNMSNSASKPIEDKTDTKSPNKDPTLVKQHQTKILVKDFSSFDSPPGLLSPSLFAPGIVDSCRLPYHTPQDSPESASWKRRNLAQSGHPDDGRHQMPSKQFMPLSEKLVRDARSARQPQAQQSANTNHKLVMESTQKLDHPGPSTDFQVPKQQDPHGHRRGTTSHAPLPSQERQHPGKPSIFRAGLGPLACYEVEEEWADVSVSPPKVSRWVGNYASSATPFVPSGFRGQLKTEDEHGKNETVLASAESNEVIDLTSDMEVD